MREGVFAAEFVFATVVLLALLLLLVLFVRRRLLTRDSDVVPCGMRRRPTQRWRPGLLRMTASELQVFPLVGLTTKPAYTWERYTLDLASTAPLEDGGGLVAVIANKADQRSFRIGVSGVTDNGRMPFELALALQAYTALRYWVESSPPIRRPL